MKQLEAKLALASEQLQLEETNRKRAEERLSVVGQQAGSMTLELVWHIMCVPELAV